MPRGRGTGRGKVRFGLDGLIIHQKIHEAIELLSMCFEDRSGRCMLSLDDLADIPVDTSLRRFADVPALCNEPKERLVFITIERQRTEASRCPSE